MALPALFVAVALLLSAAHVAVASVYEPSPAMTADLIPPVTSVSTSPAASDGKNADGSPTGWFVTTPTITFTVGGPGDAVPIVTYYDWGLNPPLTRYFSSFTGMAGTNTLYYYSKDASNNDETIQRLVFKVDTSITAPTITEPRGAEPSPTPVRGAIACESTASDALSGVHHVAFYWFDRSGSSWSPVGRQVGPDQTNPASGMVYRVYWDTALVADGLYKLQSQVRDVAGNTAFSPAQYVLVDNNGPMAGLTKPEADTRIRGKAYAITGTVTDANLATWALQMRAVGGSRWNTLASGTSAVTDSSLFALDTTAYDPGRYEFRLAATDTAGNSSNAGVISPVTIDNVAPTVVSARAVGPNTIDCVFSEDLAPESIDASYFTIPGLTVSAATLQTGNKTVAVTTSSQVDGAGYTVTLKNSEATVTDLAGNPVGTPNTAAFVGTATDSAPPASPAGLTATSGLDKNDLVWTPGVEPDLAGYNVYRDTTSGGAFTTRVNSAVLTSSAFSDTSFMPVRGLYWYKVTAVDVAGNESPGSTAVTADQVRLSAPVTTGGATLTSSTGEVSITIPSGALGAAATLQITEKARPADRGGLTFVSPAYEFSPSGQAFSVPVSIAMSYVPGVVDESAIRLVYPDGEAWTQVEGSSTPSPSTDMVTGRVDHFTEIVAAAVDVTPPMVGAVTPADNATGVSVDGFVTITFSEPMDPTTLTYANLQIRAGPPPPPPASAPTGDPVPVNVVFSTDLKTVYLYPSRLMDVSTAYYVWMDGSALKDAGGNLLGAAATSTFATAATGVGPHDRYTESSNLCGGCHGAQGSSAPSILVQSAEKKVCYTCHDGTGSSYNVKTADGTTPSAWDFGEAPLGTTSQSSYHPVPKAAVTAPVTGVTMACSNCHNAHSMTGSGERFLAPAGLDPNPAKRGPSLAQTGNAFCYTCHGGAASLSTAYISAASWNTSTGFDHKTYYPTGDTGHNKSTGSLVMAQNPAVPSKEDIACKGCHSEHGTANDKLVAEQVNGQSVVFKSGSAVDYNTYYNPLCVVCHGDAGAGGSYWPGSIAFTASGHGASTAPKTLAYAPNDPAGNMQLQVRLCKQCHEPHGAGDAANPLAYPNLTRLFEENVCYRCHGSAPNPAGARNLQTVFGAASKHDLGMSANAARKHDQDAEEAQPVSGGGNSQLSGANRHVECADCHNVHSSSNVLPHMQGTNLTSGVLAGVWGVDAVSPGIAWSIPSGWAWGKQSPATAEYQLCFKCHSAAAYGSTPPSKIPVGTAGPAFWNSPTYTDQSREFNPNNPSYHMVWSGTSRVPRTVTNFINGWKRDSQMYCSDCHKSSTAGDPRGAHGSATPWMLGGYVDPVSARYVTGGNGGVLYDSQAARDTDFTFCFGCHDTSFTGTGFTKGGANLHTLEKHLSACTNCHVAVPHGSNRKHLLYFSIPTAAAGPADPAPYNDHPEDASYGLPSDMNIDRASGTWVKEDCNGSGNACHGG